MADLATVIRLITDDPEILRRLQEGLYRVEGGVIRDIKTGRIVKHLRMIVDDNALGNVATPSGLPGSSLLLGANILTIGIVVVSTVILSQQISKVSKKLEAVTEKLEEVRSDVKVLKAVELFGSLISAVEEDLSAVEDESRRESYLELVRDRFAQSKGRIEVALDHYLRNHRYDGSSLPISELLQAYMIASVGYAKTWLEVEEEKQAYETLTKDYEKLKTWYHQWLSVSRGVLQHAGRNKEFTSLVEDIRRFWSYTQEVQVVIETNSSYRQWVDLSRGLEPGLYGVDPEVFARDRNRSLDQTRT